eukprot:scaffold29753_cov67-Phaeocystis_antarctica.AAC.2
MTLHFSDLQSKTCLCICGGSTQLKDDIALSVQLAMGCKCERLPRFHTFSKNVCAISAEQLAVLETGSPRCSSLALHGSLPLLVAASARQEVSVWDWQRKQRLNAFANGNCAGSRISAMLLLPFTKPREVRWLNKPPVPSPSLYLSIIYHLSISIYLSIYLLAVSRFTSLEKGRQQDEDAAHAPPRASLPPIGAAPLSCRGCLPVPRLFTAGGVGAHAVGADGQAGQRGRPGDARVEQRLIEDVEDAARWAWAWAVCRGQHRRRGVLQLQDGRRSLWLTSA